MCVFPYISVVSFSIRLRVETRPHKSSKLRKTFPVSMWMSTTTIHVNRNGSHILIFKLVDNITQATHVTAWHPLSRELKNEYLATPLTISWESHHHLCTSLKKLKSWKWYFPVNFESNWRRKAESMYMWEGINSCDTERIKSWKMLEQPHTFPLLLSLD